VSTPIFDHLGSSSWHSYDAAMIVSLGHARRWRTPVLFIVGVGIAFFIVKRTKRRSGSKVYHGR
jgi:inositol phosphorylceramide mannosyltransferase catalytic subunit